MSRLYARVKDLPEVCQPVHIRTREGRTLLTVDTWADRRDVLHVMARELPAADLQAYLELLGLTGPAELVEWLHGTGPMAVPEDLWLVEHAQ